LPRPVLLSLQVFDDAVFALGVRDYPPQAIRTLPPPGVAGVDSLTYSGAYPASKLVIHDSTLDSAGLDATLYG
jgi:hypothetical protein